MKRLLWIVLAVAPMCFAQAPCRPKVSFENGKTVVTDCSGHSLQVEPAPVDAAPVSSAAPRASAASTVQAEQAYDAALAYQIYSWRHRRDVFEWQYRSTILIFFVTIALVLSGIVFAAVQLRHGMRLSEERMKMLTAAAAAPTTSDQDGTDTTLKVSATGMELHSATLGVIILAISMCFFYMYLKYVYPIQVVTERPVAAEASGQK